MTRIAPPVVVVDFDGTLTTVDIGDAICDRFAPPRWRQIDELWLRREISLPEAQSRMWALVRASASEIDSFAAEVGALRPGAEQLFEAALEGRLELVLASGGFDFYIDRILAPWIARGAFQARYANTGILGDRTVQVVFPHGELSCATCAICKGKVVARHRGTARREVSFVGDGSSDICGAEVADRVFAVEGGLLAERARAQGIERRTFTHLGDVLACIVREP